MCQFWKLMKNRFIQIPDFVNKKWSTDLILRPMLTVCPYTHFCCKYTTGQLSECLYLSIFFRDLYEIEHYNNSKTCNILLK